MTKCIVAHCKSSGNKRANKVQLHRFPKNLEMQWLSVLGLQGKVALEAHHRLCSHHFLESDYFVSNGVKKLKPDSVPSQNISSRYLKVLEFDRKIVKIEEDNGSKSTENVANIVCPFIPLRDKAKSSSPIKTTASFQKISIEDKRKIYREVQPAQSDPKNQPKVPFKQITVKSFADEKNIITNGTKQNVIYVDENPAHSNKRKKSNSTQQHSNANIIKTNKVHSSKIVKLNRNNVTVKNKKAIAVKCPCPGTEDAEVPIKLVDINSILQRRSENSLQVQASKPQTVTSIQEAPRPPPLVSIKNTTSKANVEMVATTSASNELATITNPVHISGTHQQIVVRQSDIMVDNQGIAHISEPLSAILASMPGLNTNQNVYLIGFPNTLKLAPLIPQQPSTSQRAEISEVQDSTAGTSFKTVAVSPPKDKVPKKAPIAHRCLELRKSGFKIDIEGFTFFDRLGFFKAEKSRAKRCVNVLNYHIKVRETILNGLLAKQKALKRQQEELLLKNLEEECKTETQPQTESINETPIRRKRFVKNRRARGKPKKLVRKRFRHRKQSYENMCSKYKLKELKVVLSRTEVEEYFSETRLPATKETEYLVSKQKIPLSFTKCSLTELLLFKADSSVTFVDDNYFDIIEQLEHGENLHFINKRNVMIAMYMDYFPAFKKGVQSDRIKIVDEEVFNKFVSIPSGSVGCVKTFCNTNRTGNSKPVNTSKQTDFCNIVSNFRLMQKKTQHYSKTVQLEHNYCIESKE